MTKRVDFRMGLKPLCEVAEQFLQQLHQGLREDGQQLKCLPTYIPTSGPAQRQVSGEAYVLDLGGSNLRAAYVSLAEPRVHWSATKEMPWQRGVIFSKEHFLDEQAKLLDSLPHHSTAPLGYCFSYPAESQPDGDARLLRWTKGVVVPGTEGTCVGRPLLEHLQRRYNRHFPRIAVINDTVASLLAGMTLDPVDSYAGLIAGTGMNLAAEIEMSHISKLPSNLRTMGKLPVNLESGHFSPPGLTEWDAKLDTASENPGEQHFEKAVGGMYLGRLFAQANPDLAFVQEQGARGLVELATSASDPEVVTAALSIYQRSAQLVAAQLAGLALFYHEIRSAQRLRVVAEGGLAWSALGGDISYQSVLSATLQNILNAFGLSNLKFEIIRVENANMIGSAVAANQRLDLSGADNRAAATWRAG